MIGPSGLTLLSAVAVLLMGLVMPLQGFFRLGGMRALERRRQSAIVPAICLAVLVLVFLLNLVDGGVPMFAIFGVLTNARAQAVNATRFAGNLATGTCRSRGRARGQRLQTSSPIGWNPLPISTSNW